MNDSTLKAIQEDYKDSFIRKNKVSQAYLTVLEDTATIKNAAKDVGFTISVPFNASVVMPYKR
ncbi:hypothetical protein ACED29_09145 [Shewanella sp. 5S214]|uniref:hypothetical protein n=1 Tax=Shewanella sp. 5S214 TaxID=3229999 RepID=UPI00352F1003